MEQMLAAGMITPNFSALAINMAGEIAITKAVKEGRGYSKGHPLIRDLAQNVLEGLLEESIMFPRFCIFCGNETFHNAKYCRKFLLGENCHEELS